MKNVICCLLFVVAFAMGWWFSDPFERNQPQSYARRASGGLCAINAALDRYYRLEHCFPRELSELHRMGLLDESSLIDPCCQNWDYHCTKGAGVVVTTIRYPYLKNGLADRGVSVDYIVKIEVSKKEGE